MSITLYNSQGNQWNFPNRYDLNQFSNFSDNQGMVPGDRSGIYVIYGLEDNGSNIYLLYIGQSTEMHQRLNNAKHVAEFEAYCASIGVRKIVAFVAYLDGWTQNNLLNAEALLIAHNNPPMNKQHNR